jgi:hypothetical protein
MGGLNISKILKLRPLLLGLGLNFKEINGLAAEPGYETVLGPIMFLCHMNDLPDCVNSSVRLFADNCLLYRTIKKEEDHLTLQADLTHLEGWANKWGMRFYAKKCYVLSINNKSLAPYSMIYLTKVTYVVIRHVSGTFLKFLPRKPSVALAF